MKSEKHRAAVGKNWEKFGNLQFQYLVDNGLKRNHNLLDIGCGSLRGGVKFIPYLNKGKYYGIEKEESLIDAALNIEVPRYNLKGKQPTIVQSDFFEVEKINEKVNFDFMIAQSVFTHLTPKFIEMCIKKVTPRLTKDGKFFATFFEGNKKEIGAKHMERRNEIGIARYPLSFFTKMGNKYNLKVTHTENSYKHPTQKMLLIEKK